MADTEKKPAQTAESAAPSAAQPQPPAQQPVQAAVPPVQVEQAKQAAQQLAGGVLQGMDKLKQTGVTGMFQQVANQPKVTTEEKLWAGLSYVPLVALPALIIKPDSNYIKLHGRQGLLIFLIFFVCIFLYIIPYIGPFFGGLIQFAMFVLGLFSMYQAFIGNWWKIPVMGDIAEAIPVSMFTKVTKEVITGQAAPQTPEAAPEEKAGEVPAPAVSQEPPVQQPPSQTPTPPPAAAT